MKEINNVHSLTLAGIQSLQRMFPQSLRKLFLIVSLLFGIYGCESDAHKSQTSEPKSASTTSNANPNRKYPFPYRLDLPDKKYKLPSELKEVSGLAWFGDGILVMVQDEKGNIYQFDTESGEIIKKIDFGKNGDYEGIAVRGKDIWVVRSDGRLYETKENGETYVFDTPLDEDFDVEGLEWYPKKGVFLIACKGFPGQGKALKQKKTIYAYTPETNQMDNRPYLIVDLSEVAKGQKRKAKEEVDEFFNPGKGNKIFQPSGVAVHPTSGDIYIIGSVGKKLLVYSPKGKLLHLETLAYSHFPQPEGICFAPDGTLYLSTEGAGGKGKVMRFDQRN